MTINRRLEKMETTSQAGSNVDDKKVALLTELLLSLESGERVDLTKLPIDGETIELASTISIS
jgi:hypothetical protein